MKSLPDLTQLSHAQKDELIVALWLMVGQLQERVKALEGRLALNSNNSSKPPSSDGLAKPAPKSLRQSGQRPVGGQKGHGGNTLRQSVHVDEIITHQSQALCTVCQSALEQHEVVDK